MKKRSAYYLCIFALTFVGLHGKAQGIDFKHCSWEEAKSLATKENKLIFIDFYTDWCGPCKMMVRDVFPDSALGVYYNARFVNVKINAEKGEGIGLAKKYGIGAYPTLVYTNPAEETVYKVVGETGPSELIDQAKIALTPNGDLAALKEKHNNRTLSKEELLRYTNLMKASGDDKKAAGLFDEYFAIAPATDEASYKMITNYARSTENTSFQYLEQHRQGFAALVGAQKVEAYIRRMITSDFIYHKYPTEEAYQEAKKTLKTKIRVDEQTELDMDMNHYMSAGNETGYMQMASLLINRYYYNNDREISNILGGCLHFVKKPANIDSALVWAQRALAIKDNFMNNATLAMVYNKQKKKDLALKYIDASLADCRRDGDTYEQQILNFRKMIEEGKDL